MQERCKAEKFSMLKWQSLHAPSSIKKMVFSVEEMEQIDPREKFKTRI